MSFRLYVFDEGKKFAAWESGNRLSLHNPMAFRTARSLLYHFLFLEEAFCVRSIAEPLEKNVCNQRTSAVLIEHWHPNKNF